MSMISALILVIKQHLWDNFYYLGYHKKIPMDIWSHIGISPKYILKSKWAKPVSKCFIVVRGHYHSRWDRVCHLHVSSKRYCLNILLQSHPQCRSHSKILISSKARGVPIKPSLFFCEKPTYKYPQQFGKTCRKKNSQRTLILEWSPFSNDYCYYTQIVTDCWQGETVVGKTVPHSVRFRMLESLIPMWRIL